MESAVLDWNEEAVKAADYAAEFRCRDHHGALAWEPAGTAMIFGNDGYRRCEPAQIALGLLRQHLYEAGIRVLGFGPSSDGGSWALLAMSDDLAFLKSAVSDAWRVASEAEPTVLERRRLEELRRAARVV